MPIVPVVLFAAALHASWNALLKPARDRLATLAAIGAASVAICLPTALIVSPPRMAAWPELGASAVVHGLYELLLIAIYQDGDFNQVYPVARGTAPPTVALAAAVVVGETLSLVQIAGVLTVSGGLFALAAGRPRGSGRALRFAVLTGLAIASYTVLDGIGVRRSGSALGYTAWLFCANGLMMPLARIVARAPRGRPLRVSGAVLRRGALAGILSVVAYGLVLWAQTRGELAIVAALRETSVVFAALIGGLAFHERLPVQRLLASAVIGAGAAMLALG